MALEVHLSGDLGGWPLWSTSDDDDIVMASTPEDWPMLSNALRDELIAWNDDYLDPARAPKRPWRRRRWLEEYRANAEALADRVQAELGDEFVVRWYA